jgi:ABC-2 type transport system permease protein
VGAEWRAVASVQGRALTAWRVFRMVSGAWIRSTMTYRASFVLTTFGNFAMTGLEFCGILLMFSQVDRLGGYTLPEIAFLYGTAGASFGLADLFAGSLGRTGQRVRDGTLDVFLVRPAPVLVQLAADQFALRRAGRISQGLVVLVWSAVTIDVSWTPVKVLLVPLLVVSGAAIFTAVFIAGASFQIVAQDAAEVQNAATFGGNALLQYPPTVFGDNLLRGVTFVLPLAFVNWIPALYILGRPYPLDLPRWAAFAPPLVAAVCLAAAGWVWRGALRGYRSTGS